VPLCSISVTLFFSKAFTEKPTFPIISYLMYPFTVVGKNVIGPLAIELGQNIDFCQETAAAFSCFTAYPKGISLRNFCNEKGYIFVLKGNTINFKEFISEWEPDRSGYLLESYYTIVLLPTTVCWRCDSHCFSLSIWASVW